MQVSGQAYGKLARALEGLTLEGNACELDALVSTEDLLVLDKLDVLGDLEVLDGIRHLDALMPDCIAWPEKEKLADWGKRTSVYMAPYLAKFEIMSANAVEGVTATDDFDGLTAKLVCVRELWSAARKADLVVARKDTANPEGKDAANPENDTGKAEGKDIANPEKGHRKPRRSARRRRREVSSLDPVAHVYERQGPTRDAKVA